MTNTDKARRLAEKARKAVVNNEQLHREMAALRADLRRMRKLLHTLGEHHGYTPQQINDMIKEHPA